MRVALQHVLLIQRENGAAMPSPHWQKTVSPSADVIALVTGRAFSGVLASDTPAFSEELESNSTSGADIAEDAFPSLSVLKASQCRTSRWASHNLARAYTTLSRCQQEIDAESSDNLKIAERQSLTVAVAWWRFRCIAARQRLAAEPCPVALNVVRQLVQRIATVFAGQKRNTGGDGSDDLALRARVAVAAWRALPDLLHDREPSETDDAVVERMFAAVEGRASPSTAVEPRLGASVLFAQPPGEDGEDSEDDAAGDLDALAAFGLDSDDEDVVPPASIIEDNSSLFLDLDDDDSARALLLLELANYYLLGQFHQVTRTAQLLAEACNAIGVDQLAVSGQMGVRTAHQTKHTAQLVPFLSRVRVPAGVLADSYAPERNTFSIPAVGASVQGVDDDGVYADARTTKTEGGQGAVLIEPTTFEMCLAITKSELQRRSHVKADAISREQALGLLRLAEVKTSGESSQQNWSVAIAAAIVRSNLEYDLTKSESQASRTRYALRALERLGALRDLVYERPKITDALHVAEKVRWTWALPLPDEGGARELNGEVLLAMGDTRAALNEFEAIGQWEQIVHCYVLIRQADKAERIVRKKLAAMEVEDPEEAKLQGPLLYCLLGEVTDNTEFFELSWKISNGRYARAKRSLARMAFHAGRIEESCGHFREALEINPLFHGSWFTYGCALMKPEAGPDIELNETRAISAFRRCVALDPDDGMSWNNLAALYIRKGKKRAAYRALAESLRFMNRSWKVWENFMVVAIDLREFRNCIRAMSNLIALGAGATVDDTNQDQARAKSRDGRSFVDKVVLRLLSIAVRDNLTAADGQGARATCIRDFESLLMLIESTEGASAADAELWIVFREYGLSRYATQRAAVSEKGEYLIPGGLTSETFCLEQVFTYTEKEWRALTQFGPDHESWRTERDACERVVKCLDAMFDAGTTLVETAKREHKAGIIDEKQQLAAFGKLFSLRTKINAALKKTSDVFAGAEVVARMQELLEKTKSLEESTH